MAGVLAYDSEDKPLGMHDKKSELPFRNYVARRRLFLWQRNMAKGCELEVYHLTGIYGHPEGDA